MTPTPPHPSRNEHRCRGAVMTEMVLVLPLVLVIFALLMFAGREYMRVQRAHVADRYVAWQESAYADGPSRGLDHSEINDVFFGGSADQLDMTRTGVFPTQAGDELTNLAATYSQDARDFTEAAVDTLPAGVSIEIGVDYTTEVPFEQRLLQTIRHRHTRMHTDWRAANGVREYAPYGWIGAGPGSNHNAAHRDVFYREIDRDLADMSGGNQVASHLRSLYTAQPGYQGPYERLLYD